MIIQLASHLVDLFSILKLKYILIPLLCLILILPHSTAFNSNSLFYLLTHILSQSYPASNHTYFLTNPNISIWKSLSIPSIALLKNKRKQHLPYTLPMITSATIRKTSLLPINSSSSLILLNKTKINSHSVNDATWNSSNFSSKNAKSQPLKKLSKTLLITFQVNFCMHNRSRIIPKITTIRNFCTKNN